MGKVKIQIVEDERILARDIARQLEKLGYDIVDMTSSGEKAIENAFEKHPDLVLMDIKIHGPKDGIVTAKIIKEELGIPVVYITAFSDEKILKRAKISEPFGYLIKPFESRELHAVIEMALYKHKMENRIKESEEKYRTLTENTNDILFSILPDAQITYIGPQIQRYGYKPSEMISKNLFSYIISEDRKIVKKDFTDIMSNKSAFLSEFRMRDQHNHIVWFENQATIQTDSSERVVGLTGVLRDVTKRKNEEEERKRLFKELEVKNAELERLVHVLSHDLKNPLITINGFLGLLKKDIRVKNPREIKSDLLTITQSVKQMYQLFDELSEYCSKINRPLVVEKVAVNLVVNEALDMLKNQIQNSGVKIKIISKLPAVNADRNRLLHVFLNLIKNGIHDIEMEPKPLIEIDSEQKNGEIIFSVRDNGIGINPKISDQVFNLFGPYHKKYNGLGIGLTVTKRIIEMHGGRIWIESKEKEKGRTFYFTLGFMR